MNIDLDRGFPVQTRALLFESVESYGRRLAAANGLPEDAPESAANELVRNGLFSSRSGAMAHWCEIKGGLHPDHFENQKRRIHCEPLTNRYMCRLCAGGEEVAQVDHSDANCCIRHGLWTGPGTPPIEQILVTGRILSADLKYRRLVRSGRISLSLLCELSSLIERDRGNKTSPNLFVLDTYASLIELADVLTRPDFLQKILAPTKTFQEARATLRAHLCTHLSEFSVRMENSIWLLLRPAFLLVREYIEGRKSGQSGVISIDPSVIGGSIPVMRPLEPFGRFLQGMPFARHLNIRDRYELHLIPGQANSPRRDMLQGSISMEFLCVHGHRFKRSTNTAEQAFGAGRVGCPYCSCRKALAGFNSMAETNPKLATEWDVEKNKGAIPSSIRGATMSQSYWWRCSEGHSWKTTPFTRAKGSGCPCCSGRIPIPGVNSMDITHPEVSSQWDYEVNNQRFPGEIMAGSGIKFGWICDLGHQYMATPDSRTGRGTGCPVCANLQVVIGFNDLATTHPELAVEWDEEANGNVRSSDIVAGSKKPRSWRCQLGHTYKASPSSRSQGRGCPICSGQRVAPEFNSLAVARPDIAARWHPSANGEITPWHVTAHSGRKVHWKCVLGHDFEKTVAQYVKSQNCPVCTGHQVLAGFNDLGTRYPEIASEWHPEKNGGLLPKDVFPGNKKRWWICAKSHELKGTAANRIKTSGCTRCPQADRVASEKPRINEVSVRPASSAALPR